VWNLERDLPGLIADCRALLDANSRFLFLTVYAIRMSALAIGELLAQATAGLGGRGVGEEFADVLINAEIHGRGRARRLG
jgi:23S rRNA (cytosine1962-C5)-methyltransferase